MKNKNETKKKSGTVRHTLKKKAIVLFWLLFNPRLLLCFGIGWMITNGWAYLLLGLGLFMNSPWMTSVATVYLTALWFPFTPEKIVTLAIAIWLMTILFPNDQKTLAVLREELKKAKEMIKRHKNNKNSDKSS